ncbi:MAG: hypothetical protein RBS02_17420, partial [Steroidobacteraceae bacterium]|nr:hypothetical protein [Steroidobacteraceae bacterium]
VGGRYSRERRGGYNDVEFVNFLTPLMDNQSPFEPETFTSFTPQGRLELPGERCLVRLPVRFARLQERRLQHRQLSEYAVLSGEDLVLRSRPEDRPPAAAAARRSERLIVVEELPKTPSGKVRKDVLRARLWSGRHGAAD